VKICSKQAAALRRLLVDLDEANRIAPEGMGAYLAISELIFSYI
jgi:hypothetical protein